MACALRAGHEATDIVTVVAIRQPSQPVRITARANGSTTAQFKARFLHFREFRKPGDTLLRGRVEVEATTV
jgi:hypothetical protein